MRVYQEATPAHVGEPGTATTLSAAAGVGVELASAPPSLGLGEGAVEQPEQQLEQAIGRDRFRLVEQAIELGIAA